MKRMPDKPETWAWLAAWVQSNWPGIYAGGLAFVIAAFRIAYTGGRLRQLLLEAPLCGFIGLGVSYSTELLGVSPGVAPFFGSMVGLIGVETVRAAARRLLEKKAEQL
ncbi:phage holin, lambda family [Azotobacter salinestris]|uniref:phage holin, lambda family n=1 Tax=Azotobacter salinestris TaxID=69964 RepID=UPI0032DE79CF